ncbi:MAG TPA: HEPN domain-containing protein [Gemmataceae bacterium]|jgi:uncharacterized protein (UPF0332 family)
MNGRDFLATTRHLAGRGTEADWRSAVSRAYYAAFHVTRDLLASRRFRTPQADRAHNYLYVRLNNCGEPAVQQAANQLKTLRNRRNMADYEMGRTVPVKAATDSIAEAESIIRTLDALTPAELTQITTAMKAYEQAVGDVTWQP